MIKVLFFIPQLVGGGAEKVTINIMRILDKNIFDIHLVVTNKDGPSFSYLPENITLHDLKVFKTSYSILKLRRLIQKIKPDILFSSLLRGHIAVSIAMIGIKKNIFVVLRSPNSPKLLFENNQLGYIQSLLLENAYRMSNTVLAQTPEMKEELIKYHGITKSKINVFLNPLDTYFINEQIENIENPFSNNMINVVASGRLTLQKGFDVLIESFAYVVHKRNDFHLYIIGGDDGEENSLNELVKKLSLEKNVHFLGYKKNPYQYYFYSDLYVLSSRWEGLPNTVLENLYLKKPIVATRCIPFMNTLIENRRNGLLVDVGNIEQLSNAILNYNTIKVNTQDSKDRRNETNELFLNFCKEGLIDV